MGSIHYDTDDGSTMTYQGGGIWRTNPSGNNSMVSPPDLEYRDGTVTFPAVNINGSVNGSVEELRATKDVEYSRARSESYTRIMEDCEEASNLTISVQSQYADAWGRYLEAQMPVDKQENVSYDLSNDDRSNDTVEMTVLKGVDGGSNDDNDSVTVDRNTTIDVSVLGTEVSIEPTSCEHYCYKKWVPVSMSIYADDTQIEHDWGDPLSCQHYWSCDEIGNLNNRDTQEEIWDRTFDVKPDEGENVSITLSATSWTCDDSHDWKYVGSDTYEGIHYDHEECRELGGHLDTADASAGDNPEQVRVLADGDQVPVLDSGHRQRNAKEVLGSKINATGHLQLQSNQFVFLFEITNPPHTRWEDAGDDAGDPNYNDAIAILEIEDQEGRETSGNDFQIRLTMNEVVIEPTD
jgi:hypothetical protein